MTFILRSLLCPMMALMLLLLLPAVSSARYSSNAFDLRDDQNHSLFTNRDLRCVSISGKKATFTLNETATRFFYEHTRQNIGKDYFVSLCGEDPVKSKIHASVYSGKIQLDLTKDSQNECLNSSFRVNEACQDCPICKN